MTDQGLAESVAMERLLLPSWVKFRQFKFRLPSGRWISRRFSTGRGLKNYLDSIEWKADAYFSSGRWLNPETLRRKPENFHLNPGYSGYVWANYAFLGSEMYFDLDGKPGFEEGTWAETLKLWGFLSTEFGFRKKILVETGRGFQIHCLDWGDFSEFFDRAEYRLSAPLKKISAVTNLKKNLVKSLRYVFDCNFCFNSSIDVTRIFRLPGSVHQKSGKVCCWYHSPKERAMALKRQMRTVRAWEFEEPRTTLVGSAQVPSLGASNEESRSEAHQRIFEEIKNGD